MSATAQEPALLDPTAGAEPNVRRTTRLGRTDLEVCRIGIGGGGGLSSADLRYAMSRGINYYFHSTDLHAAQYERSRSALRSVFGRASPRRDKLVLSVVSYVCDPEKIFAVLADQLHTIGADYVDVFNWGWVTRRNEPGALLQTADDVLRKQIRRKDAAAIAGVAREAGADLRSRGYARYLGITTHDRPLAAELANDPLVDVVMCRYNIAHRGAEREFFPKLPPARPGVVTFNAAHGARGMLAVAPPGFPKERYVPAYGDLYRFALDRPEIDVVLTGPATREHVDASLRTLDGPPLEPRMRAYLEKYGDIHSGAAVIVA